jgi:hypothetical protein
MPAQHGFVGGSTKQVARSAVPKIVVVSDASSNDTKVGAH